MKDKFNMSKENNILYAKRNIVDNIYRSSRLEGIAVTFPDTQMIYEGKSVAGISVEDIVKINNLKHAWQFIFDSIDYPMDLLYIRQLNQEIGAGIVPNSGLLRTSDVSIGGTTWKPDIPNAEVVIEELKNILCIPSHTERAVTILLYLMRSQLFYDGNKRVAQLAANQIMIQNGVGILSIPVEHQKTFFEKLIEFYETNDDTDIKGFLYDTSIEGTTFSNKTLDKQPDINRTMFINHKNSR